MNQHEFTERERQAIGEQFDGFTLGDPHWERMPFTVRKKIRQEAIDEALTVLRDRAAEGIDDYETKFGR